MILKILYSFFTAGVISWVSIKPLLYLDGKFNFFDNPDDLRKVHDKKIPTLGGIAIFLGWLISSLLWVDFVKCPEMQFLVVGVLILTFLGIKDDISVLDPYKKFAGQIVAAFLVVYFGNVRITSFYGIFGVGQLPVWVSIIFTILVFLTIINALNLIDGINGLATSISLIGSIFYGVWFFLIDGNFQHTILAAALAGALISFLRFNITPAKIFMGDTGSMVLGFLLAFFSVDFIETNAVNKFHDYFFHSSPTLAIAILMLPLYDLFRSMSLRIIHGKNPLKADKNHIHHLLLRLGLSHEWVTFILVIYSISVIVIALLLRHFNNHVTGIIILAYTILLNLLLVHLVNKKEKANG